MHRLAAQYPHLKIVLNGGLNTLHQVDTHLGLSVGGDKGDSVQEWVCAGEERGGGEGGVHGCMLGRAVYTNPFLFSRADTKYFGASSDMCLTRGQVLERYYDYCERVMQEQEQRQQSGSGLCDPSAEHVPGDEKAGGGQYSKTSDESGGGIKIGKLVDAVKHVFHGCPVSSKQ